MKRILLTGMSGTGKSTLIAELAARGYKAIDADSVDYSDWVEVVDDSEVAGTPVEPGRDWVWRGDRVQQLLDTEDAELLFLSGCAPNMRSFLPRFDRIVLLIAPAEVIVERLRTRTGNPYGKRPEEIARVLDLFETVEPLLRRIAHLEIATDAPIAEIVAKLLELVGTPD